MSAPASPSAWVVLVFSKDRPLQLDAALRSWMRHCKEAPDGLVKVLYKASSSRMLSLYRQLMREHPGVDFFRERDFRRDLLVLVARRDFVGFVVDDSIFVRDFSIQDVSTALGRNRDAVGFSLRLGRNTTYCYSMDHAQKAPDFEAIEGGALRYRWPGADYDFGYPLELSSSMYRSQDLLPLLERLEFKNPNTLEDVLSRNTGRFRESRPFLACWEQSRAFSIPVNKVQQVCENRAGGNAAYSAEALAEAFARGERIQTESFDGFVPNACHQEVELKTAPEAEATPLVTVVIPCYKQAQYLPEAVASVAAQTFADWEIVIVNDGSPDDTSEVARGLIQKYAGQRIRLLEKKNGGLAGARNAGIGVAAGAYILPLDADDLIEPAMLEKTTAVLEARPDIAIVYTDVAHFGVVEKTIEAAEFDFRKLVHGNQLNYCSLCRREAWERAGGCHSNMIWGYEDWDFWVSCGEHGLRAKHIPGALLQYRVKDASMYTVAAANDQALRARIILNHPRCYAAPAVAAARAIWSQPSMPAPPGAPKVSVVIPTHDRPVFLARALQSVLDQTMQDFEILVINDRGIDVSGVIPRFSAKARITYLPEPVGRGVAAARNCGLRAASGKYIAHLDDDDLFLPDHLETLVTFLESTGHKAAYTDAACAEEEIIDGQYQVTRREVLYSAEWDNDRILVQNFVPTLCFMHERSCAIAAGDFDEDLNTHEDWEYWIRLSRVCPPVHIKKVTCEFRKRKDGTSITSGQRADFLRTMRLIYKKHAELTAGKATTRRGQKRVLKKLKQELRAARVASISRWISAPLRRIFHPRGSGL